MNVDLILTEEKMTDPKQGETGFTLRDWPVPWPLGCGEHCGGWSILQQSKAFGKEPSSASVQHSSQTGSTGKTGEGLVTVACPEAAVVGHSRQGSPRKMNVYEEKP